MLPRLWKANTIVFISSFCVMVIELIAARIMAPYIGVSLYTWTSIIGVILAGIALGNFVGGIIADKYPRPFVLVAIFLIGSLATIVVLPFVKVVAYAGWFNGLPLILSFMLKTACVFFLPAVILSMVSPLVIKITLPDVGKTGGVVGTIYAFSTVGAILGTFMTGYFFILWFGTRTLVWLVAVVLIITGIISWFLWKVPERWKLSPVNLATWIIVVLVVLSAISIYNFPKSWQEVYTKESNYYAIKVTTESGNKKVLALDHLIHNYVYPDNPTLLDYGYEKTFAEIAGYVMKSNPNPRVLHLGAGGYSFARYMAIAHPGSVNDAVEIDPEVTKIAYSELGLPVGINITTYNEDARLFLINRNSNEKYDIVAGDVFNDLSTPFHLTTLQFDRLVKSNMSTDGIYMINIIDDFQSGRYIPSCILTLKQVFKHVSLFSPSEENWNEFGICTFIIVASDRNIDPQEYKQVMLQNSSDTLSAFPSNEVTLNKYLSERDPILLTDNHAPTDILVAPLIRKR